MVYHRVISCCAKYLSLNLRRPNKVRMSSSANPIFDCVQEVDIDSSGKFKYILIKVYEKKSKTDEFKYVVRGYAWAGYHVDILEKVDSQLRKNFETECVGGGRIIHKPEEKSILVFGYSQGYGRADHSISTELLKKKYPDYSVSWSDEGY